MIRRIVTTTKYQFNLILILSFFILLSGYVKAAGAIRTKVSDTINLCGKWRFQTDPDDVGVRQAWYKRLLTGSISLPGSMVSNHLGDEVTVNTPWVGGIEDSSWFRKPEYAKYREPGHIKVPFWLQPEKYYKGVAWYQLEVTIS